MLGGGAGHPRGGYNRHVPCSKSNQHVVPRLVVMAVRKNYVLRERDRRLEMEQKGKRTEEQADFP